MFRLVEWGTNQTTNDWRPETQYISGSGSRSVILCLDIRCRFRVTVTLSVDVLLSNAVSRQGTDGSSFVLIHTWRIIYCNVVRLSIYKLTSLLELRFYWYIHEHFATEASFVLVHTCELRYWSLFCLTIYT